MKGIGHSSHEILDSHMKAKVLSGRYAMTSPASHILLSLPLKVKEQVDYLPRGRLGIY